MDDELERLAREGDAEAMCELGFRALEVRDYHRAAQWLEPAAKRGIPRAQNAFGILHNGRFGLPEDWTVYVSWVSKAAEAGYLPACHSLAFAYDHGLGVERDIPTAIHWYLKFARKGYRPSIDRLIFLYWMCDQYGCLYELRSLVWRRKLARQGDVRWQRLTGEDYEWGCLRPPNMEKALYWYRLAAAQGDIRANFLLKQLTAKWATAEAEIFAARKAAEHGNAQAQLILGRAYFQGLGLHQSFKKAVPLLFSAAEQGRAEAMYWLSELTGYKALVKLVPGDSDTWLRRAAEAGYAEAQWQLSCNTKDAESLHWARLAAAQGHDKAKQRVFHSEYERWNTPEELLEAAKESPRAMWHLFYNYRYGKEGFEQSLEKAAKWQIKCAERYYTTQDAYSDFDNLEHSEECYEAGELYLAGEGVPQSDAEALKWYRRGAAMENVLSAWRIGQFYEEGRGGLKQSYEEALKWYHSALGELKYISWDSIYGLIYGHDDKEEYGFAYPMVSDDRTVAEWYRARADAGDANAQWLTGVRYHLGRGLEYSEERALACFRRSAEQKNVVGMTFLGVAYQQGIGQSCSGCMAREWYTLAREQQIVDVDENFPNTLNDDLPIDGPPPSQGIMERAFETGTDHCF